jgi:hypothetical protein
MEAGQTRASNYFWPLAIFALAIVLRIASAIPFSALHADEVWQYLEPAYRLIGGHSVVTWDQRDGLRSWLLPEILALPMYIGHILSPASQAHLLGVRIFLAAFSLLIVWGAYRLGKVISPIHAFVASFVAATWSEFIYMAPRALTDSVSATLFAAGAALLLTSKKRSDYLSGFLLGLAFVVRIQTFPALAALLVFELPRWKERFPRLLAGGLGAIAADSAANLVMGAPPLMWIINNFSINLVQNKSASFGVESPWAYLFDLIERWNFLLSPLLFLALWGARKYPSLLFAALAHIIAHSLIPHKEWRFDYLFHVLILLLAGVGAGNIVQKLSPRTAVLAFAGFLGASVFVALQPKLMNSYFRYRPMEAAMIDASAISSSCAIAIYHLWDKIGASYALSDSDRPFYVYAEDSPVKLDLLGSADAYGAVITGPDSIQKIPREFDEKKCFPNRDGRVFWCVLKKRGECKAKPPTELGINSYLISVHR